MTLYTSSLLSILKDRVIDAVNLGGHDISPSHCKKLSFGNFTRVLRFEVGDVVNNNKQELYRVTFTTKEYERVFTSLLFSSETRGINLCVQETRQLSIYAMYEHCSSAANKEITSGFMTQNQNSIGARGGLESIAVYDGDGGSQDCEAETVKGSKSRQIVDKALCVC